MLFFVIVFLSCLSLSRVGFFPIYFCSSIRLILLLPFLFSLNGDIISYSVVLDFFISLNLRFISLIFLSELVTFHFNTCGVSCVCVNMLRFFFVSIRPACHRRLATSIMRPSVPFLLLQRIRSIMYDFNWIYHALKQSLNLSHST